jgi:hypothetical protein
MLNYKVAADNGSMYNTPATYSWYLSGLVFEWLKEQGGVAAMEQRNKAKKDLLYKAIDASDFYSNPIQPSARRSAWPTRSSTRPSSPVPTPAACSTSRAIARWAVCVPPSITPPAWMQSRLWLPIWRSSRRSTADE